LLHSLGGIASMGADVLQQSPHLRRSVSSAALGGVDNSLLHVAIMTRQVNEAASIASWGNEWGNMPHRFQPIST
jgi:hypothetical protein